MHLVLSFRDGGFDIFERKMRALGDGRGHGILAQALNEGGRALRASTVAATPGQTGIAPDVADRSQTELLASAGHLTYTITVHGGNVRAKYLRPTERLGAGVLSHEWNKSVMHSQAFMTSGRKGQRAMSPKLNGHVFVNPSRKWGGKISVVRTGMYLPTELTRGQTKSAYEHGARATLNVVMTRLGQLLP